MMMLRALSLIGLVLTLVTGSVAMASARHQARAVGEVVICSGYGIATISIDADGNPTGPVVLCPDCTAALAALTDVSRPAPVAPHTLVALFLPPAILTATGAAQPLPFRARAPPETV